MTQLFDINDGNVQKTRTDGSLARCLTNQSKRLV